ncbi:Rad52/Rad22 family DNA repair protein [Sulfurimonas sp.]|jgi:DNA repair and recombination protein RAD52|uniref:Rad52/Rad22 family DNA repair protein n=1 Tax=Sulfurimonas sp. TaxID=2022749 RepID=UPI002A372128|nr:Rad52/Rad22 family DNA repair protein [Sulfurimonas sp.]MDY0122933.1 Rad52/Rad22 family DNA repair protein [Sulfurimonas sp.]
MFNDKQLQVLNYELDSSRIKTREKGNISLSYIEGHDVIETANRIFGYGNWSYTITKLEQVSQEQNHNQNVVICYKAVVRIIACDISHTKEIVREDVGFGSGVAKTLSDAHEGAAKEAVTDALKRAMRTFGNQFGNSLYDKGKNHYSQPNNPQLPQQQNTQQANNHTQAYQHHNNSNQQPQHLPQDYSSLYNLGLTIMEQGNSLVVIGDDIFSKRDSIKACGFRWDGASKLWYKPLEQQAA